MRTARPSGSIPLSREGECLEQIQMAGTRRIYFDNAATSWPKAARVLEAMNAYMADCGAAAGRGSYRSAQRAGEIIDEVRAGIAASIGAESRHCVSLHSSGTTALNAAIHGLVHPGDHVVTTAAEHNSVLRPLEFLRKHKQIELTIVPCDDTGLVQAAHVLDAVRPGTRLVAMTHASNVTGAIQPIGEVGKQLQNSDTILLCDAAQTLGYLPIDVRQLGIDILASPGHKGAGGPLGTAALYVDASLHDSIVPTIQGGTGFDSDSLDMPNQYPAKLEAGNLNVLGFAGWLAAMEAAAADNKTGSAEPELDRLLFVGNKLRQRFAKIAGVRVYGFEQSLPVVSISIEHLSPLDVSTILDSDYGIETRAGLHCAALIHEHLGTQSHGTLRISAGSTTTDADIEAVVHAISEIAAEVAL